MRAKPLATIVVIGSTSNMCLVSTLSPVREPTNERSVTIPLTPMDDAVGNIPVN